MSTLDGRSRLFAFRRVGALPLIQAVGATTDAVYGGWRGEATPLGAVLAVLCSGILALLFVLKGELRQGAAAVRALDVPASSAKRGGRNRSSGGERPPARYPRPEPLSA